MFEMHFVKGFLFWAIGGWGTWRGSVSEKSPMRQMKIEIMDQILIKTNRNMTRYGATFESYHMIPATAI